MLFHHSSLRLPRRLEALLRKIVVTPRLHGIHHSTVAGQRDSNFSSGLALWDAVHGTLRADVRQAQIAIGVPPYGRRAAIGLREAPALPFRI